MVPFLHKMTFRHTGPMEQECCVKDLPIIYHIRMLADSFHSQDRADDAGQEPHGAGNKFKRSKTETCWMWEETVVITPYLIQASNDDM